MYTLIHSEMIRDRVLVQGSPSEIAQYLIDEVQGLYDSVYQEYYHEDPSTADEKMEDSDEACMLSMLEEIVDNNDPIQLQWYLKGTIEWYLIVTGSLVLRDPHGDSLYNSPLVNSYQYGV